MRERNCGSTRAEYRKAQDEQARQACTIESSRNEVRVVLENARAVVTKVELREEADNGPAQQHARLRLIVWNVSRVLDELREVDLVERELADAWDELR